MAFDGLKIVSVKKNSWITWRDLMRSLLKVLNLNQFLYENSEIPEQVSQSCHIS